MWNTIKKVRAENGFSKLLEETISNEVAYAIEEYTCSMYHFRCDENVMDKNDKNFWRKVQTAICTTTWPLHKMNRSKQFFTLEICSYVIHKKVWFITLLYKTLFVTYPLSDYISIYYGWELSKCGNFLELSCIKDLKFNRK